MYLRTHTRSCYAYLNCFKQANESKKIKTLPNDLRDWFISPLISLFSALINLSLTGKQRSAGKPLQNVYLGLR